MPIQTYDAKGRAKINTVGVGANYHVCQGRLTSVTGTPVPTSDQTSVGTLYWTPYKGDHVGLHDGSSTWEVFTFTEQSLSLSLTSGKPYDIFLYDSSGTPTLESLVWTDDTNRATALTLQNGILCKSGDTTRRYLGSIYASGANVTEDSATKRFIWNYYHRVGRHFLRKESTDNWTYSTSTWRQANGSTSNQVEIMNGYQEDDINVIARSMSDYDGGSTDQWRYTGIGVNSTSALHADCLNSNVSDANGVGASAQLTHQPRLGYSYYAWLERSEAGATATWYGDGGDATKWQCGIQGSWKC